MQGDLESQLLLGVLYFVGIDIPRDYAKSFKWYEMAALQGDATAVLRIMVAASSRLPVSRMSKSFRMTFFRLCAVKSSIFSCPLRLIFLTSTIMSLIIISR